MNIKKVATCLVSSLLIFNFLIIIHLTSFNLNAFNEKFYKEEFKKYNIYEKFPKKDIDKINSDLLLYLKNKREDFPIELFNEKEISHLKDVKELIQKINILYHLSIILLILFMVLLFLLDKKYFRRNFSIILLASGLFNLLIIGTLLILVNLNFENIFTIFHNIFFPQGNWLFSPSDNIIKLYPMEFFYDIAKKIFLGILFYGNILIGVGILLYWSWAKTSNLSC